MAVDIDKTVHDPPSGAARRATDFHNEVDRHRDLAKWDTLCHFADQIFDAIERFHWRICVQGRNASWMARVPELDHFKDRAVTNFANNNAIWAQPQRCAGEVTHRHYRGDGFSQHRDAVMRHTLQLGSVFNDDNAVVYNRRFCKEGV